MSNAAEAKKAAAWSKPFHGIQHLGRTTDVRWATVADLGDRAELTMWYVGCGFHPREVVCDSVALARAEGERWVAGQIA